MPYYPGLRYLGARKRFAADKLIQLRAHLRDTVPFRRSDGELLLATWNIRDFGGSSFNPQPRLPESLYYLAEIVSHFDLIAIQEVNRNLSEFNRMMEILGKDYTFIATDPCETEGGNDERMAFVYDKRKVAFRGIAGEIVLPKRDEVLAQAQFARTPFVVTFQVGWLKLDLCTVHLYYGDTSGEKLLRRIAEIQALGEFFVKRSKKENTNTILLGDFNIVSPTHSTMQALMGSGFDVHPDIQRIPTNLYGNKHYDQIAHFSPGGLVRFPLADAAGKVRFDNVVFHDEAEYAGLIKQKNPAKPIAFDLWRTWQMSDHYLLWTRLLTDFSDEYLARI